MNVGPMIPNRMAQPVDHMLENTDGFLDIDTAIEQIGWLRAKAEYKPSDHVATRLFQIYQDPQGRELIEWLFDLTARAPLPAFENSFESTALQAAKAQARAGIGRVIAEAICLGERLINEKKEADQ